MKKILIFLMLFVPSVAFASTETITLGVSNVNGSRVADTGGHQPLFQLFTPVNTGLLDAAQITLGNLSGSPVPLNVCIKATVAGIYTGSCLSSVESLSGTSNSTHTLTFASPASLTGGTQYALFIDTSGSVDAVNFYRVAADPGVSPDSEWTSSGTLTGNGAVVATLSLTYGGGGGSATSTAQTCTYLYGASTTPCVQIVDNPNADLFYGMVLLFCGFFGVVWFFRKRR